MTHSSQTPSRIVSLVPSWTETLIAAGKTPIGRTRYCEHPESIVSGIPAVGGTKEANWDKIEALKPDLIILDKEENPKDFAKLAPCPFWASHIQRAHDLPWHLGELARVLGADELTKMASRWETQIAREHEWSWDQIPGLIKWVKKPQTMPNRIVYMIWKNPWMAVSQDTFIGSMFEILGAGGESFLSHSNKYPELSQAEFDRSDTLVLLSTEPFPFAKRHDEFLHFNCSSAIVDGSFFSWFGIRALEFLESLTAD